MTKKARGDSRARSNSRARKEKLTMWLNPAEYYCRVCDKRFDKLRALCAHMRKHGDREWRGLLPPPKRAEQHPHPRPPTYEASTSTGMRGELGIDFQREPQEKVFLASPNLLEMLTPEPQGKGFLASPKFDSNMLPATEPQEKVPVFLKSEMQADPEPKEKVLTSPKIDLNVSLSPTPDPPEADVDSRPKFKFDLNAAPEEDEANDYRGFFLRDLHLLLFLFLFWFVCFIFYFLKLQQSTCCSLNYLFNLDY